MLKSLFFSLFLFLSLLGVQAQGEATPPASYKITLATGEVYRGKILAENDRILMLETPEGDRYQLRKDEIATIAPDLLPANDTPSQPADNTAMSHADDNKFSMMLDLSGGTSFSRNSYGWIPAMQGALVLGVRDLLFTNTFLGVGAGYGMLFAGSSPDDFINLIPVFARLQSIIGKRATAPYVEMDAGYGFSLHPDTKGGLLLRLSVGVAHKFSPRTAIYAGIYGSLQGLSGAMRDIDPWGNVYKYDGNTTTQQIGAKVALRF